MYRFFVDLLQPFTIVWVFVLVVLMVMWRRRVEKRRRLLLITAPIAGLTLMFTPAVAIVALGTLEWQYAPALERPPGVQTVVVLSGYAFRPTLTRRQTVLGLDSQFRCVHAADLYHQPGSCRILVCGGKVEPDDVGEPLAVLMREYLIKQGVRPEDVLLEDMSRNTYENAVFAGKILREEGVDEIVLVTTATHLPRAVPCFEAQNLKVHPSGCDYKAYEFSGSPLLFFPRSGAIHGIESAFHEWAGIVLYWIRGRFDGT